MIIGSRQRIATIVDDISNLCTNGVFLRRAYQTKCLGVTTDCHWVWALHINSIIHEVVTSITILKKASKYLNVENLCKIYHSIIILYSDYGSIVSYGIESELSKKLQRLQNRAARVITGDTCLTHGSDETLRKLGWSNLCQRRFEQKALLMFKIVNGLTPR